MSLGLTDTLSPRVLIDVLAGPQGLTGEELQSCITSFEYVHEKKERPKILLEFDNTSGRIFNTGVLVAGLTLKIRFGYQNVLSRPFMAPVARIAVTSVGEPGKSLRSPHPDVYGRVKFEVKAQDWKTTFHPGRNIFSGRNVMVSTAARQIARTLGFREDKIYVQEGLAVPGMKEPTLPHISLLGTESAEQFLLTQAAQRGFEFWCTDNSFHFHAADWDQAVVEEIAYFKGPDLLEYSVDGDFDLSATSVSAKAVDPYKGKIATVVVGAGGRPVGTIESDLPAMRRKPTPDSIAPKEQIIAVTDSMWERAAKRIIARVDSKWKIRMTVIGNPAIFKGTALNLSNFGPLIDGRWVVEGVRHTINTSEGYRTQTDLTKAKKQGPRALTLPLPVTGPGGSNYYVSSVSSGAEPIETGGKRKKPRKQSKPKKYKSLRLGAARTRRLY